ncbi:MAG: NUDIX hydrolase [Elusimicrobia bacterium]|nr:NUDIX hydrolase [Elusimicrobiota bacterium]
MDTQSLARGLRDRPLVTVDVVLLSLQGSELDCLLIRRGARPHAGSWALPGGFVRPGESLEQAAFRELAEESNVRNVYLEQLYTFGAPGRDPRGRVITVAYYALIDASLQDVRAGTDASDAGWHPVARLPPLAFDHAAIVGRALERLRGKINYTTAAFQLLPREFTVDQLRRVYSIILGRDLDRRNFRKRMLGLNILQDTGRTTRGRRSRPGRLFRLKKPGILTLQERGIVAPFQP